MKHVRLVATLALLLLALPAHAEPALPNDPLMQLETRWADGLLANDLEVVADLMHPNFRLLRVYGDDAPISKGAYLGMTGMNATMIDLRPVSVTYYDDVATVVIDYRIDWTGPQGPLPPRFYIVDTWVKTDDGWKIIQRLSNAVSLAAQ